MACELFQAAVTTLQCTSRFMRATTLNVGRIRIKSSTTFLLLLFKNVRNQLCSHISTPPDHIYKIAMNMQATVHMPREGKTSLLSAASKSWCLSSIVAFPIPCIHGIFRVLGSLHWRKEHMSFQFQRVFQVVGYCEDAFNHCHMVFHTFAKAYYVIKISKWYSSFHKKQNDGHDRLKFSWHTFQYYRLAEKSVNHMTFCRNRLFSVMLLHFSLSLWGTAKEYHEKYSFLKKVVILISHLNRHNLHKNLLQWHIRVYCKPPFFF